MPQIFTASADTRLRAGALLTALGLAAATAIGGGYVGSGYATRVGFTRDQPVPFSHKHHVGGLGIDCRYCHTGVERTASAGLPPTQTCMTCHSQVWTGAPVLEPVRRSLASGAPLRWNRVARVPDYVFFNHSIHVSRGVPCVTCHGRVDEMPLLYRAQAFEMRWCLSCHRDPAPQLRPASLVTRMDWSGWDPSSTEHGDFGRLAVQAYGIEPGKLDSCSICHR